MDIWRWIEGLDEDITDLMYELTSAVVDGENDRVDSPVPTVVGMARERQLPWVEVFARHWELQSLIFHRHDPAQGLPKAIALLERSHRDDAIDCPQTICVTQDVCAAYSMADGPGYADDRISVCEETMDRISPAWTCWSCISAEKAAAMIDKDDCEAAVSFLEESEELIAKAGGEPDGIDMRRVKIDALRKLGRYEEALELARKGTEREWNSDSFVFECNAFALQMLGRLGRFDAVLEGLPVLRDVLKHGRIDVHADTIASLVRGGAMEFDDQRVRDYALMMQRGIDRGAFRMTAETGLLAVKLCAEAGQSHVGHAFAEMAREAAQQLRSGAAMEAELKAAAAKLAELSDKPPDVERWSALGFLRKAAELARVEHEASPADAELFRRLAGLYLDTGKHAELRTLLEKAVAQETLRGDALWYRSFLLERTQGLDAAIKTMRELVDEHPDWAGASWRLAYLLDDAGDLEAALAAYNNTVALFDDAGGYDWERMVVAARLGEHDIVRDSAARLDIELEGESGPIVENWGGCLIHYADDSYVFAIRTGPVTARIDRLARYGVQERYEDEVVIRARPENPDADENSYYIYPHIETIKTGNYRSYMLDGVHPGEEKLGVLQDAIAKAGFVFERKSSDQYQLTDPQSGEDVMGLFARIGVPEGRDPADVHEVLTQTVESAELSSIVWIDLVTELQLDDVIEAQSKIAKAWDL